MYQTLICVIPCTALLCNVLIYIMKACVHLEAIDLLERTLYLDPDARITAAQALAHPYLARYADPTDEPNSEPYYQSFEEKELDIPTWKSKSWAIESSD